MNDPAVRGSVGLRDHGVALGEVAGARQKRPGDNPVGGFAEFGIARGAAVLLGEIPRKRGVVRECLADLPNALAPTFVGAGAVRLEDLRLHRGRLLSALSVLALVLKLVRAVLEQGKAFRDVRVR